MLVDASAWMKPAAPPEDNCCGPLLSEAPPVVPLCVLPPRPVLLMPLLLFWLFWLLFRLLLAGCCAEAAVPSDVTTERRVCASLVASAFFRYTTCTLPSCVVGWSSFEISDLARLARAADGARSTSELVRGSASTDTLPASAAAPAPAFPPSISLFTIEARSEAMA